MFIVLEIIPTTEDTAEDPAIVTEPARNDHGAVVYFQTEEEADEFAAAEGIENYDVHEIDVPDSGVGGRLLIAEITVDDQLQINTEIATDVEGCIVFFDSEDEADVYATAHGIENYDVHDLNEIIP